LGERLLCKQEVIGSIPFTSTISLRLRVPRRRNLCCAAREEGGGGSRGSCATIAEAKVCRRLTGRWRVL
jgi:hypothetical protein